MKVVRRLWLAGAAALVLPGSPVSAESLIRDDFQVVSPLPLIAGAPEVDGADLKVGPVAPLPEDTGAESELAPLDCGLPGGKIGVDRIDRLPIPGEFARPVPTDLLPEGEPSGMSNGTSPGFLRVLARKVPEPGSMGLLGIGLSSLIALRRLMRRVRMA